MALQLPIRFYTASLFAFAKIDWKFDDEFKNGSGAKIEIVARKSFRDCHSP